MFLIVGARGRLGGAVARSLLAVGKPVRAVSRTPEQLADLRALGAEVVAGDLREVDSLARACQGVDAVLAAAHAFDEAQPGNSPRTVDDAGNRRLIDAAKAAGARHFVLTSIVGTRADHPIDLFRSKFAAEEYLRAAGLSYTILRPTAFMELWLDIIGEPVVRRGRTTIFGGGNNPINFVSSGDVARFALLALEDPRARGQSIEIGGPENLTLMQLAEMVERVTGHSARKDHIPLPAMRLMRVLSRPIKPGFSRQVATAIMMDTRDMTFDPSATLARYPLSLTTLEEVVRRRYGSGPSD